MTAPKPKRRWFQFSLSGVLAVIALIVECLFLLKHLNVAFKRPRTNNLNKFYLRGDSV